VVFGASSSIEYIENYEFLAEGAAGSRKISCFSTYRQFGIGGWATIVTNENPKVEK
jgi:hypothetical protein